MKLMIMGLMLLLAVGSSQALYKAGGEVRISPRMLNYQGYLTDTLGNPVTNPAISMTFAIYDAESSGNQLWFETQTLSVEKGIFHALVGTLSTLPDSIFTKNQNRWLGLTVSGNILSPRTRIVSAPYAYTATYSDTAVYSRSSATDNDWNFLISDVADTTLQTGGRWGLARSGSTLYGIYDSTHVNLGVASTTGASGLNYKFCTVGGGRSNTASNTYAVVGGGYYNTASGTYATVAGGNVNTASGSNATVAGGQSNLASALYAAIGGGLYDTITGSYSSIGGGFNNNISTDYGTVAGGRTNNVAFAYAAIGGGYDNSSAGWAGTVAGGYRNSVSANYASVAGGNADTVKAFYGCIGSGFSNLAGDTVTDTAATVAGGYNNSATDRYCFVGGGYSNTASGSWATVAGGNGNEADTSYAAVCGGVGNTASGYISTVSGGQANTADGYCAAIGGGRGNNAANSYATVGGGYNNTADSSYATVAGGYINQANGFRSTIGGGGYHLASGMYSTIPGGYDNTASGNMSFAAGYKATAAHTGSFVWADSTGSTAFSSTVANQFRVRAVGGIDLTGNVAIRNTSGTIVVELGEGLDYAEGFDVAEQGEITPGVVLAIDPENPGKLKICDRPYDTKVAGIAAGANSLGSGVRLGNGKYDCDVALAGRVFCNVDATEAGIEPGDLLTTSVTPGYAMKVTDYARAQGTILGKAMQSLEKGAKGQILVLVTLQ